MKNGDIGTHWAQKIVVVDIPTLLIPQPDTRRFKIAKRSWSPSDFAINRGVAQFIALKGRYNNMPCEVWSFLNDADLMEELAAKANNLIGDYVSSWVRWDSMEDALLGLRVDAAIHTVYDSDSERVARYWGMRGQRVPLGGIPSS